MADYNNPYQQPPAAPPPPPAYYPPGPGGYYPPPVPPEKKGMAIASMVLGIIALCLSCCYFISGPCAIIGLILGIIGVRRGGKGMAIAGIIMCSLTLLIAIGALVLFSQEAYSDAFWDSFWDAYYSY